MAYPQIRIGGTRVELRQGGSLCGPADMLAGLTRNNLRALRDDPELRAWALPRVISPPLGAPCTVRDTLMQGVVSDCVLGSGFQYSSDEDQQLREGCAPADVWSDLYGLKAGHERAVQLGRARPENPVAADCDDLTPSALAVAAWIAWFAPPGSIAPPGTIVAGRDLHDFRDEGARFATSIVRPPKPPPPKPWIAHAFGLTNRKPPPPQPEVKIRLGGVDWYVWDPAAHWGMTRPPDPFYLSGDKDGGFVAYEIRRDDLDGLAA